MGQDAVLTQGTKLFRKNPSTLVYDPVPGSISLSGPDAQKSEIRVTDLDSLAEEYKGGLADFGRLTIELYYNSLASAVHAAMFADFSDTTSPVRRWRIDFVNGKKWWFSGYVAAFPNNTQPNDTNKVTVTIRLSGIVAEQDSEPL
jgi:hypothetical protein